MPRQVYCISNLYSINQSIYYLLKTDELLLIGFSAQNVICYNITYRTIHKVVFIKKSSLSGELVTEATTVGVECAQYYYYMIYIAPISRIESERWRH